VTPVFDGQAYWDELVARLTARRIELVIV